MSGQDGDYDPEKARPRGSNADEWLLFLDEHQKRIEFLAVQIAESIEDAERNAIERAIDRMSWPEITAYQEELRRGQDIREDAGGFMLRAIGRLFGLERKESVTTYQDAAQAMLKARGEVE